MDKLLPFFLSMAANYLQSPSGQERLISLVPTLVNGFQGLVDKVKDAKADGVDAAGQKAIAAQHLTELVAAAAAKAEADHKAHPDDDSGFDPGVFRD